MNFSALKAQEIAVLLGGTSAEREVSLQSGRTVSDALRERGYRVRDVDPGDADWIGQLDGVAFAFNALHGPGGEDGSMQGALNALGVPSTGSGVLGSALAMDKQRSKQLWQGIGLSTAGFTSLSEATDWQEVIDRFGKVFVKPSCEGSSIGMAPADNAADLEAAFQKAARYGGVLAEKFINGPEYTVGILGEPLQRRHLQTTHVSLQLQTLVFLIIGQRIITPRVLRYPVRPEGRRFQGQISDPFPLVDFELVVQYRAVRQFRALIPGLTVRIPLLDCHQELFVTQTVGAQLIHLRNGIEWPP